jgi:hypothetical protein
MPLELTLDSVQTRARRLLRPGLVTALPWGRGSGKTYFDRALVHTFTLGEPNSHVGIIYPTLKRAKQVIWSQLRADYTNELRSVVASRDMTNLEVTFKNGSRLTTWGAENANAIRGQRFTHVIQDETDEIHPDTESAVIEPTFSKVGLNFVWVKTGTPSRGRHGILYRDYTRGQRGVTGYASMLVRSDQSPQVSADWLARIKQTTPPAIFAREYDCNFDAAEGVVYGDVFGAANVAEPPEGTVWSEILIGIDHGWEHPGVFLLIGVIGKGRDATLWVLEEIYAKHKTEDWWVEQLSRWLTWYPAAKVYADHMPARIEVFRRKCHARTQEVDKSAGSVEDGIATVATLMMPAHDGREMRPRLMVAPRCVNLLTELGFGGEGRATVAEGVYRRKRDPQNPERFLDEVEKRNDDGCDALRYPCYAYFGGPDRRRAGSPHEALG